MKKANLLQVICLIYGAACGGAFGMEGMVGTAGPGVAMVTLILMPLLWSLPIALTCAELGATFPVEGGFYEWGRMAFGDFVGFLAGWWTWIGSFATNAAFAVMFANYLGYWVHLTFWTHWLVTLLLIWSLVLLNHRGIRAVGDSSIGMTLALMLPFVALTVLGLLHWHPGLFSPFVHPQKTPLTAFGESLVLGVWLFSGYDKITVSAEEIENPSRTLPLAFMIAVPFVALSYILPAAAGLAGTHDWTLWRDNYFSTAANIIGGPWLGAAMTAAALVSNALLLNTTMLAQSRLPMMMARDNFMPQSFKKLHPRYKTPTLSLFLGGVILSLLCIGTFTQLIVVYSVTQMLCYLLIYATYWRLRDSHRGITRPFQVPGGTKGFILMAAPSICIAILSIAKTEHLGLASLALATGPIVFFISRILSRTSRQPQP
ncbi:MAG: APC family permease [Elusimicrobiota bacterium]